jgi:uncharacterized glyoxalase superfamily protein PhnB
VGRWQTARRRPLADTDGAREFAVRDPEGNLWAVGDYAGA